MANDQFKGSRNRLSWKVGAGFALILGFLVSCGAQEEGTQVQRTPGDEILVTPQWLLENLEEVTVLETGRSLDDFLEGQIPGAAFVAREVVWDQVDGVAGMLPEPGIVARDLSDAGVFSGKPVVVYDGGNGLWASRLFWALEYLGHSNVHLLDGGFGAWVAEGYDVSTEISVPQQGDFIAQVQSHLIADKDYILANLSNDQITVLDTRSPGEYSGEDVRSARGGHIPGAVNIEWTSNTTTGKSYRPLSELTQVYENILVQEGQQTVALCQTGVRGAHSYVALRILGEEGVRVYDGSWEEWGNVDSLPIEL